MHVVQLMLVKGDTHEEAMASVADKLSDNPDWSDWHNANGGGDTFAGRWVGYFGEDKPDYLCYGTDPERAEEFIGDAINSRMEEYEQARRTVIHQLDKFAEIANSYNPTKSFGFGDEGMLVFRMKRLVQILNDEWTSDTAIYDLENWTPELTYFRKDVADNPNKWWLIPVDFHH